jgi:apolipoprotein N-acyltransferase
VGGRLVLSGLKASLQADMHLAGCGRFWLWAVAGALITLSFVGAASIGLLVLPFAALATAFVARSTQQRAEALGLLVGAASICFLVAGLQLGGGNDGLDPRPWLVAGVLLAAIGTAAYALVTRRLAPPA